MNILITGSSSGIGLAVAEYFISKGHTVYGIDKNEGKIKNGNYIHYTADITAPESLPVIDGIDIIFNNAGQQNGEDDIKNNLTGTVNVTEKYINSPSLMSVLFNASASALNGQEFPLYAASKAGVVGYMKNTAIRLAPRGITVNALCFGGVLTELNKPVTDDLKLWRKIMDVTPLKKWVTVCEAAEWVYFLTVINKSMSGQCLLIDNGENDLNPRFVWSE